MSLVNLAHVCSSLNNASKARLALTSIPHTKLHLSICIALQQSGLISTIVRGGPTAPPPHLLLGHPTVIDDEAGAEPVTQSNVASRRLWVGLKYWQSEPVLGIMTPISKPKRKITVKLPHLRDILQGRRSGSVDGLRSPGECIEKKIGGLALLRVN
jgi:ribosomal protein S8